MQRDFVNVVDVWLTDEGVDMSEEPETPKAELRKASEETAKILMPYLLRFHKNINRTKELLKVSELILASSDKNKNEIYDDQLRAAVVFLHATLEDSLRSLSSIYLPVSGEEQLNLVPLVGTGNGTRPEKFFLGKLAAHRGKSVDELIEKSVKTYLSRTNYNDTTEIAVLLKGLGVGPDFFTEVSGQFSALGQLMQRRHEIVHRADLSLDQADVPEKLGVISRQDVEAWIESVEELNRIMMAHFIHTEMTARMPALNTLEEMVRRGEAELPKERS